MGYKEITMEQPQWIREGAPSRTVAIGSLLAATLRDIINAITALEADVAKLKKKEK